MFSILFGIRFSVVQMLFLLLLLLLLLLLMMMMVLSSVNHVFDEKFSSLIRASNKWACDSIGKPHFFNVFPVRLKLFWRNILLNWQVSASRLQILAHRNYIDAY